MSNLKNDLQNTISDTLDLLQQNPEWQQRYSNYARDILKNKEFIKSVRQTFREWAPLYMYINFSNAKNAAKSFKLELRFLGQTVAELRCNETLNLHTTGYEEKNEKYFGCKIKLSKTPWDSLDARKFRSFFKSSDMVKNKSNEEHRIESLLLTEFSKSGKKVLKNIKPVMIHNLRLPMPTPLKASNHKKVSYSGPRGGGIDILTRTGTGGLATNLCIMEVKDENVKKEPPKDAIKQAVIYATFIRELLRSDCGEDWWKIFGFGGTVPAKLTLFAACVMPSNTNDDKTFADMELNVSRDTIKLHYVYFTEINHRITGIDTSL